MRKPYLLITLLLAGVIGFGPNAFAQTSYNLTSNIPTSALNIDTIVVTAVSANAWEADGVVETNSGISPYTYTWMPLTINFTPIGGDPSNVAFDPGSTLLFSLVVTDAFGCNDTLSFDATGGPVSLADEIERLVDLKVYPNPSDGNFHLSLEGKPFADELNLLVKDQLGRTVYLENLPKFTGKMERDIQLDPLSAGVYYLGLGSGDRMIFRKLIIE